MFSQMGQGEHHNLYVKNCQKSGLKAIVAVHDSSFGVAFGGTRIVPYASEADALKDALRLSRAMSLKAACAKIPVGGAKGVIMADPAHKKDFLRAYGEFVESLGGRFVTGPDVNLSGEDARFLSDGCGSIVGLAAAPHDTGTATAYGVLMGMRAAAKFSLHVSTMANLRVAVQGLGNVGWNLAAMLHQEGAELTVADIDATKTAQAAVQFGAKVVSSDEIHRAPVDLFSPCAGGAVLTTDSLPQIYAKMIVGAANNQLADDLMDGTLARSLGKVYCPDFVANSGGLIAVYHEYLNRPQSALKAHLELIYETSMRLFREAELNSVSHVSAAMTVAQETLVALRAEHAAKGPATRGSQR